MVLTQDRGAGSLPGSTRSSYKSGFGIWLAPRWMYFNSKLTKGPLLGDLTFPQRFQAWIMGKAEHSLAPIAANDHVTE